jgi:hypothetical protein
LEVIGTDTVLDLDAEEADLAIRYARTPPPRLIAARLSRGFGGHFVRALFGCFGRKVEYDVPLNAVTVL